MIAQEGIQEPGLRILKLILQGFLAFLPTPCLPGVWSARLPALPPLTALPPLRASVSPVSPQSSSLIVLGQEWSASSVQAVQPLKSMWF
jgi:hypothetical protein